MGRFIVAFPGFKPKDYWELTVEERHHIVQAHHEMNKQGR